jgi:ABC-2 type transport system permease protein/oleandomycin transport system permease protein
MVVFFYYIFGGAIKVPGSSYINYLMGGMLVMAAILASAYTGSGVAADLQHGLVDRFRSLPMVESAVLTGRIIADLAISTFIILIVLAVSLLVGFRPNGTILEWLAVLGILLLSSFTFSWLSAFIGLTINNVEAVAPAVNLYVTLSIFVSNAFVPTSTMPALLRAFANHQPFSLLIDAVRGLVVNQPDATATWQAIVWCVSLLGVFIPLSVWTYGRRTAR